MKSKKLRSSKSILRDVQTGKSIQLPKIHGNTKIANVITGQKTMTISQWKKAGSDAADRLIKAFSTCVYVPNGNYAYGQCGADASHYAENSGDKFCKKHVKELKRVGFAEKLIPIKYD